MIAFVRGTIATVLDDSIIVEMGGIGLQVLAPLRQLRPHPVVGQQIMLHTHMQPREDAWLLFGFAEQRQLELFRQLMAVSGVGAKTALAILDHLDSDTIIRALMEGDYQPFSTVKGLGKTKAQRIIVDLKNKFKSGKASDLPAFLEPGLAQALVSNSAFADVQAALEQMGYHSTEARAFTIAAQQKLGEDADVNALLKEAMRQAALA